MKAEFICFPYGGILGIFAFVCSTSTVMGCDLYNSVVNGTGDAMLMVSKVVLMVPLDVTVHCLLTVPIMSSIVDVAG